MHLESANVLQLQFVGGSTEIAAELRNRADVGSLCRWRKIADGHVLDHAVAQRAHLGHLEISCLGAGCNTRSSQTGGQLSDLARSRRDSGFVQSPQESNFQRLG